MPDALFDDVIRTLVLIVEDIAVNQSETARRRANGLLSRVSTARVDRDTMAALAPGETALRALMRDPRYWRDRDPEIVARVTAGFRALVSGEAQSRAIPLIEEPAP